ncbi:MAG: type I-C CRISPR-associated protein Cas8c/Csd1 [Akkermansiaceae bacterium]|nr:type I-C CRISPR-associated protein Cas8c/Csd1 [Akkermansiaceae bacterium]
MILQSLNDLYTRLAEDPAYEIAPPGFSPQKICFRMVLKTDGSLFDIQDARSPDEKGKMQNTLMLVPGEAKPPGAGINPCLLWDNQTYLLGRQPEDKADGFGLSRFEAFRQRHLELESTIKDPSFSAVCRFLEQWSSERITEFPILNDLGTGFGIFQVQGEKKAVHESSAVQEWWLLSQAAEVPGDLGQCLLTGEEQPIARLHPKIKGVTGAQAAGASIVSFNANAYESYGKAQSYNAPVSEAAAFRYGTALNSLLAGPKSSKHRIRIGDTTTVFWTEKPSIVEDCFADIFSGGSQATEEVQDETKRGQLQRVLEAIRSGGEYQELGESGDTPFHILGLAPNAARVSIRFYHRSTTTELLDKLHDHQRCLEIDRFDREPEFPSIRQLTNQIRVLHRSEEDGAVTWKEGKEGSDKFISTIAGSLTRAIVEGVDYPTALYFCVIRRTIIERRVTHLRAAIIKAILIRNYQQTISIMLDESNTESAYRHGRLFAVLEKIQEEGHYAQTQRKLEHTIKEKYFSSACTTPAAVFPRLETLSVHHQRHLNPGRRVQMERLIGDIKWEIFGTKKTHSLTDQGQFILGYYHQRKKLFTSNDDQKLPENEPTTV